MSHKNSNGHLASNLPRRGRDHDKNVDESRLNVVGQSEGSAFLGAGFSAMAFG